MDQEQHIGELLNENAKVVVDVESIKCVLAEQELRPSEEACQLVDIESLHDNNKLLHVDKTNLLEHLELLDESFDKRVKLATVNAVESTIAGTAEDAKLLGDDQGELVDDVDVPVVKAALEDVGDVIHDDGLLDADIELHGHEDWTFDNNLFTNDYGFSHTHDYGAREVDISRRSRAGHAVRLLGHLSLGSRRCARG